MEMLEIVRNKVQKANKNYLPSRLLYCGSGRSKFEIRFKTGILFQAGFLYSFFRAFVVDLENVDGLVVFQLTASFVCMS